MINVIPVYDIEGELEVAITTLLNAQLEALSSQDNPKMKRDGIRVEVFASLGNGKQGHLAPTELTGLEMEVEDTWETRIELEVVTPRVADIHRLYRAYTRYVISRLPALANNKPAVPGGPPLMVNHVICGPMYHRGSSPMFEPEKGFYHTRMNYEFFVSVHDAAWASLTQQR